MTLVSRLAPTAVVTARAVAADGDDNGDGGDNDDGGALPGDVLAHVELAKTIASTFLTYHSVCRH